MMHGHLTSTFSQLFHYSRAPNRSQIQRLGVLLSSDLIRALDTQSRGPDRRRGGSQLVRTLLWDFILNDQDALKFGHVNDPASLDEAEFLALLDQFVFFWPGNCVGPNRMGQNFANRYSRWHSAAPASDIHGGSSTWTSPPWFRALKKSWLLCLSMTLGCKTSSSSAPTASSVIAAPWMYSRKVGSNRCWMPPGRFSNRELRDVGSAGTASASSIRPS